MISKNEILMRNPQIDSARVARMEAFCRKVEATGIDLRPVYRISPPLGETHRFVAHQQIRKRAR